MTKQQLEVKIKQIVRKAEKNGLRIYKNNINNAKPLNRICGSIKAKASYSLEDLLCRH